MVPERQCNHLFDYFLIRCMYGILKGHADAKYAQKTGTCMPGKGQDAGRAAMETGRCEKSRRALPASLGLLA